MTELDETDTGANCTRLGFTRSTSLWKGTFVLLLLQLKVIFEPLK